MRKLKGIPLLDSLENGTSECFSDIAMPLYDMPAITIEQIAINLHSFLFSSDREIITRYCSNPPSPAYIHKLVSILRVVDDNSWRVLKRPINIPVQRS